MKICKNLSIENLPHEEWRDIAGYEGRYQVSNLGRVKNAIKNSIKKQTFNDGYYYVSLHRCNDGKLCAVHRVVAKAFLVDYCEELTVDHKDDDKSNNTVSNLQMLTRSDNVKKYFSDEDHHEEFSDRCRERMDEHWSSDENIRIQSERMQKFWNDHPEIKEDHSIRGKQYYQDDSNKKAFSDRMKSYCADEENKKAQSIKVSERNIERWSNPNNRRRMAEKVSGQVWVNNGVVQTHVPKDKADTYIKQGYRLGMLPKRKKGDINT